MSTKDNADRVLEALAKKPELLAEIKARMAPVDPRATYAAWAVLMIEHEWGQRDEGWTLFPDKDLAEAHKKEREGKATGAPGQWFEYTLTQVQVNTEVWTLMQTSSRPLYSTGNHLPGRATVVTADMVR